ncbi:MAG: C2H2-type zinc finger protein [Candidatus Endonucleobacter bathymodioli]|uniref:C2H2-type zinc finger protein n=1 Tax=Candidatus Endonucleibacter bathymodioli TaxID=539814 RepID=A0AA90P1F0_9GAMM|nr:C2H2-type zinc finger protein [Candidatus Endonucleobacter bathymodioli]
MILKFLCIPKLYKYKLDILTMVKGILFAYCLLASLCIKAAIDDDVYKSINIDKKKEQWFFMLAPNSDISGHRKDFCYIAMVNNTIMVNESIGQKISTILIELQDNDIEEVPNVNNCQSITCCSAENLSVVEYNNLLCALNSEQKIYKYALVVVFTNNDNNLIFRIEQIELYNIIYNKNIMINDLGNRINMLIPRFASCKHIRSVPENNSQRNNAENNINDDLHQTISNQLLLFNDVDVTFKNSTQINNANDNAMLDINLLIGYQELNAYPNGIILLDEEVDIETKNNSGELLGSSVKEVDLLFERRRICESNVSGCEKPGNTKLPKKQTYKCDTCGKVCVTLSQLTEHTYIHTGEKPYRCNWKNCDKAYSQNSNLTTHIKKHNNDTPFYCQWCNKKFSYGSLLERHIVIHTGQRSFKCTFCSKLFSYKNSLDQHEKLHLNEKNFSCLQCDKVFNTNGSLAKHRAIHSGNKKYKCVHNGCKMAFFQKCTLVTHMTTHKNVKQ